MAEETCAHPDCDCALGTGPRISKNGQNYCSEFCAATEGASTEDCECGHADCAA
jgi:hypothetical protein